MLETLQEFIERGTSALQYPADDPYATMILVLIVIAAAVMIALALIAFALPAVRHSDADAVDEERAVDGGAEFEEDSDEDGLEDAGDAG